MATLTYDPTPADQPEFTQEELDSIARGEVQEQAESQMLAGKFKDAEALEQAYIELQQKLGEKNEETTEEVREQDPTPEEVTTSTMLSNASDEWAEKGELSKETMDSLSELSSQDLINAYMELQQAPQNKDLTQAQADAIFNSIGGAESYNALTEWAADTLPEAAVNAYNAVVEAGDPATIQLMLAGVKAAYDEANGVEGTMLTGKPAGNTIDAFRSQAEVVAAMQDPRYDKDPAYRNDVFEKLSRSNLDY